MAAVFDFLPADESRRRAAAIAALTLDGKELDSRVANALSDIEYDRTIEGASTVTLKVIDPDGSLLDSGLFSAAVDIELPAPEAFAPSAKDLPVASDDPLGYRLVRIKTAGALLTLEFEDREIADMRKVKTLRKASRSKMTRAEFVRMIVRETESKTPIRFWSPELHQRQPIRDRRDLDSRDTKRERRTPGFGDVEPAKPKPADADADADASPKAKDFDKADSVRVKGVDADRSQIRLLEQVLDTARSVGANRREMIGVVECITQESVVANHVGRPVTARGVGVVYLVDVGLFHQDSRYWPASRDPVKDARAFLKRFIPVARAHKDKSIGWCVDQVQRSYTVNTVRQGDDYDQWEDEARETVNVYLGADPAADRAEAASTYVKRYEYRRGEPGGEREDTWEASGRLAAEVNFRRFMDYGVFHYVSDNYLRKAAARMIIDRQDLPGGVLSVDVGDFDVGKPRRNAKGQNVGGAEIRVEVLTDVLAPPLGGVWIVRGYGPCDGRYLITNVRGSYLKPKATVTVTLPVPKLAEPASETARRSVPGDPRPRGQLPKAGGLTPKQIIDRIVLPIAAANSIRISAAEVEAANERHNTNVYGTTRRSWHKGPPSEAWAVDLSDNWASTSGSRNMDRVAKALADRFDIPWTGSGAVSAHHSGNDYQLIYKSYVGGNHYNHVHFGVKRSVPAPATGGNPGR